MRTDPALDKRSGGLARVSIARPVGTLAIASVVFVMGLFFLTRLPIDLLPEIEYPQLRVSVSYPGVAPEIIEEQVTRVLERNLAATEGLQRIASTVNDGRTDVDLDFAFGTNLDLAMQDAARYLEQARPRLPADIQPPRIRKFDPGQNAIWEGGFSSTVRSEVEVRDWVENNLMPQLIAIPGVSSVEANGGMVRELEVIIDQDRLRSYGLAMSDVVASLAAENVDIAGGRMTSDRFDVVVKTEGLFSSVAEIENVLLALPGSGTSGAGSTETAGSGRAIRLGEIATVRDGHREQRVFARLNGVPSVQVQVYKLTGTNTVAVADEVLATLARLERTGFIPPDIEYNAFRDPTFFIRGALNSVGTAAIMGGLLAMSMVLMFLGSLRKGFIIGLSIPIALMATFSMMGASGLTLNIISLGGLALGVGLLLDNAIVVLENIFRHREKLGKSADDAARDGSAEVVSAITAGTLTNLAAVVPFLLVSGVASLVFREMILTISFAIVATLAAALTLVPTRPCSARCASRAGWRAACRCAPSRRWSSGCGGAIAGCCRVCSGGAGACSVWPPARSVARRGCSLSWAMSFCRRSTTATCSCGWPCRRVRLRMKRRRYRVGSRHICDRCRTCRACSRWPAARCGAARSTSARGRPSSSCSWCRATSATACRPGSGWCRRSARSGRWIFPARGSSCARR